MSLVVCFFFFQSRRRHRIYWRDWISDVCSSDLRRAAVPRAARLGAGHAPRPRLPLGALAAAAAADPAGRGPRAGPRSEERRVGEEGRSRGSPDYLKKNTAAEKTLHTTQYSIYSC